MAQQNYTVGDSFKVTIQDGTMTIRHDGYDKALAAIERVRELLAELESTGEMVSPYLVAKQFSKALDGEQE